MTYYDESGRVYSITFLSGGPAVYWLDGRPLGVDPDTGGFTVPLHEGPDPVAVPLVFDGSEKFPIIDESGGYVSAVNYNMQYAGGSFGQIIGGQPYVDGVARTLAYMSTTPSGGSLYVLEGGISIDARSAWQHESDITARDLSTHQTLLDRVANVATAVVLIAAGGLVAGDMAAAAGVGAEGVAGGTAADALAAPEAVELFGPVAEVAAPVADVVVPGAAGGAGAGTVGGSGIVSSVGNAVVSGVGSAVVGAVRNAINPPAPSGNFLAGEQDAAARSRAAAARPAASSGLTLAVLAGLFLALA